MYPGGQPPNPYGAPVNPYGQPAPQPYGQPAPQAYGGMGGMPAAQPYAQPMPGQVPGMMPGQVPGMMPVQGVAPAGGMDPFAMQRAAAAQAQANAQAYAQAQAVAAAQAQQAQANIVNMQAQQQAMQQQQYQAAQMAQTQFSHQQLAQAQSDAHQAKLDAIGTEKELARMRSAVEEQKAADAAQEAFEKGKAEATAEAAEANAIAEAEARAARVTVKPYENFDATSDAKTLRKAMKGWGCDEKLLIQILAHRSNEQRQEIISAFRDSCNRDLIKDLKSETSGNFKDTIMGLMKTAAQYDAYWLRKAMKGLGSNKNTLIEIICTRTPRELEAIKDCYSQEYKRNLDDDVASETGKLVGTSHLKHLLHTLLTSPRDEDEEEIDMSKAMLDAKVLYDAGEAKWLGTDENKFIDVLALRSYKHLRQVFVEYSKISNYDISKSVKREMSGTLSQSLRALIASARNLPEFFAEKFRDSMEGLGTHDDLLIRLVVSRCERDLADIKDVFARKYGKGKTLAKWIADDTRGDYKKVLIELIDGRARV